MLNKQKVAYTVNKEIVKQFNRRAKELSINKSLLIENLIKKWMKENEEKN
jgi:hypothetical protein